MKKIIKLLLPSVLIEWLRDSKNNFIGYHSNFPITQIYINDNVKSTLGVNNFFSTLEPLLNVKAIAKVVFYNCKGDVILKINIKLNQWASSFINVEELFRANQINSTLGIVTVQLVPRIKFTKFNFLKFGFLSSHFFMFYRSSDDSSTSHMHPLSPLDPKNSKDDFFQTSQRISTSGLSCIKLYQMNPSMSDQEIDYTFITNTGEQVRRTIFVSAKGVSTVEFSPNEFQTKDFEQFYFSISPLPSPNSKPMLMRVFNNGLFSMSHC